MKRRGQDSGQCGLSRDNAAGAFGGGFLRDLRDSNKDTAYVKPASVIDLGDK